MRNGIATLLAGLLAACGTEPATAPAGNEAKPAAQPAMATASGDRRGLAERREDYLRGCIGGGRDVAGPNVPVEAHCACAVDRLMAGRTAADLDAEQGTEAYANRFRTTMRQCQQEIGMGPGR